MKSLWRKYEDWKVEDMNDMLTEKRLERAEDAFLEADGASQALTHDGTETLVLINWIEKAQRMIQMRMTAGRINGKDLDYLKGLMRFCADAIRKDLGPGSSGYFKERCDYIQSELASLKRSFKKMMESTEVV